MNVFFVMKDGSLVTPALSGTILEGVTRSSVIQVARDMGREVTERKITLDEWRDGVASGEITEVFACGTAAVITPIGVLKDDTEFIGSEDAQGRRDHHGHPPAAARHPDRHRRGHPRLADPPGVARSTTYDGGPHPRGGPPPFRPPPTHL